MSSMMRFIPESRMTSCNWFRLSFMLPYLGIKALISLPLSCMACGKNRQVLAIIDSGRYG